MKIQAFLLMLRFWQQARKFRLCCSCSCYIHSYSKTIQTQDFCILCAQIIICWDDSDMRVWFRLTVPLICGSNLKEIDFLCYSVPSSFGIERVACRLFWLKKPRPVNGLKVTGIWNCQSNEWSHSPFFITPSVASTELIFLRQVPAVDFRCADKAMVLQAQVTKGPWHGKAHRILVRHPHPRHVRFVVHAWRTLFPCSSESLRARLL